MRGDPVQDAVAAMTVETSVLRYRGAKWDVVTDTVRLADGQRVLRDVVVHPGAVGVVALRGAPGTEEVLLVRQYRHPVAAQLWELPAGLLDQPAEPALAAAQRELAEEAQVTAARWDTLLDVYSSPGMSGEAYRVYLARDISDVPADSRHERTEEEATMLVRWVTLDDACTAAVAGRIHNAMAVAALLATSWTRHHDWATLRPAEAPWPQRPVGRE